MSFYFMLFGSLLKYNSRLYPDKPTVSLPGYKFHCFDFEPVLIGFQKVQRQQSRAKDADDVIKMNPF